jgi:threonine dehydratase
MTATDTGRSLITIEDIRAAAEALAPVAVRTPLLPDDVLAAKLGIPLWHKAEPLQRGGSFKFRGAYNYVSNLDPHVRAKGVVAPSSGITGRALRWPRAFSEFPQRW